MIRIIIADDHQIFRQGLSQLLETQADMTLVGQTEDGDQLLKFLEANPVDIAIVDVSMPGPGVPAICKQIAIENWPTKVIVLTMHQDAMMAQQMLASGACGFVLKRNAFDELQAALKSVATGETYVSPVLSGEIIKNGNKKTAILSEREIEVAQLVAKGYTNQKIANELSISVKTVQTHRARAMQKLEIHSAAELVRRLSELNLLR